MRLPIIAVLISITVVSCSRVSEDELFQMAQNALEKEQYREAVQHLEQLVDRFPQGKHAEESLFLLGNIYNDRLQEPRIAIAMYRRLHRVFPEGERAPGALFLVGFLYNNVLQQYDSARITYEQFLREYPEHDMATSAQFELENLGKSPDELFQTRLAEKEQQDTGGKAKKTQRTKK